MDIFSKHVCDVTPPDLVGALRVFYLPRISDRETADRSKAVLSLLEIKHSQGLVAEDGKQQFFIRRAFQRYCGAAAVKNNMPLSDINFAYTKFGQPFLANQNDLSFSFSACAVGYLGAWSQRYGVGIDIEDPRRSLEPSSLAKRYFAQSEVNLISQTEEAKRKAVFLKLWTLKEAALKSIGKGLAFGLDKFEFALSPHIEVMTAPKEFGAATAFNALNIPHTQGCAALVYHQRADN